MFKIKCFYMKNSLEYWYIENQNGFLLWKNGTSSKGYTGYGRYSYSENGYFKTEQKAQQFLDKWLPKGSWWKYVSGCWNHTEPDDFEIGWLTIQKVKEAAQKGDLEALDCSIEHWKQIVVAGYDKFMDACDKHKTAINDDYCALCQRFCSEYNRRCSDCFLAIADKRCKNYESVFRTVAKAKVSEDKPGFEKTAVDMLNLLVKIRNEKFGNPYILPAEPITYYPDYKFGVDVAIPGQSGFGEFAKLNGVIYTKGDKEMNENERRNRLKQVDIDLAALEEEKKKLLEKPKHQFKAGDVATANGYPRFIVSHEGKLISIFMHNGEYATTGQEGFEEYNYKYVGRIKDFISKKTIEDFQRNGKML